MYVWMLEDITPFHLKLYDGIKGGDSRRRRYPVQVDEINAAIQVFISATMV